jgi:phage terminase large subunit
MSAELIPFDWKHPEYVRVFQERVERLRRLRANPAALPAFKLYYRDHPAQFISDWACTFDPRNVERGLPTTVPFLLFPRQVEWIDWVLERWRAGEPGITEKSREMGMSWLMIAFSCTMCLFNPGMVIGVGSRKEEYVDSRANPKALFEKARFFLQHLPPEFLDGWDRDKHAPFARIIFPGTGSAMTGESGDGLGRGDRTSLYFIDESAFLEHPQLADASLSQTTNCRIDVSTPNGLANSFAQRRHSGKINVFTFSWRHDPRKGQAWYDKQVAELDPLTIASEIDIDYRGSIEGALIPNAWIQAAIGSHLKLGITPTGMKRGALDVADSGANRNAFAGRHGILLEYLTSWSGKNSDIYKTTMKAFAICDERGYDSFDYDCEGVGSGVKGDANVINETRKTYIQAIPFRGSGQVWKPESCLVEKRKNKDMFATAKSMAWWALRMRFEQTYRAVVQKMPVDVDAIISIDPTLDELLPLTAELSQISYSLNSAGKVVIEKTPEGMKSPDLADSVNMCFSPQSRVLEIWAKLAD